MGIGFLHQSDATGGSRQVPARSEPGRARAQTRDGHLTTWDGLQAAPAFSPAARATRVAQLSVDTPPIPSLDSTLGDGVVTQLASSPIARSVLQGVVTKWQRSRGPQSLSAVQICSAPPGCQPRWERWRSRWPPPGLLSHKEASDPSTTSPSL